MPVVDLNEEEKEKDHVVEERDKVEDKDSNVHFKLQLEFLNSSDDIVHSANRCVMKFQDDKKIEKEFEGYTTYDADSDNLGVVDFESNVE